MRLRPASRSLLPTLLAAAVLTGCYSMRSSNGGGQTQFSSPRIANAEDVAAPPGYRVEVVATGLTFPTGIAFDADQRVYVIEAGYSYGEVWTTPRLVRIGPDGSATTVASGGRNGPWTGVAFHSGAFYIAEGGELEGGKILKITPQGETTVLVDGLPSMGDHHTNGPAIGADGAIYFAIGTATNSGIVGEDNAQFGWLKRRPDFHDIPCADVKLTGRVFSSANALTGQGQARTGAFVPFGQTTSSGEVIRGRVPCSGSVMRVSPRGGTPELIAWGFRNPFGLAFSPAGDLFVTENGYDERGSRPVWGTADVLWRIERGKWYGWPDYSAGRRLSDEEFKPPSGDALTLLLQTHPNDPPKPIANFGVHSSSNGFDFARSGFGHEGEAFVAQFGDQAPTVGKTLFPVGFKVVRVDTRSGVIHDFAVNRGKVNGPASKIGGHGFERPVAARFDPAGTALYVVDFGVLMQSEKGSFPQEKTGVVWRISREGAR